MRTPAANSSWHPSGGPARSEVPFRRRSGERGVSVLVILTLLACMALVLVANSEALAHLKQELRWLDHQQQERLQPHEPRPGETH